MNELTVTERGAQRLIDIEHKREKCKRCCGRMDMSKGGYVCGYGELAKFRMAEFKPCPKFVLSEDRAAWLK